MPRPRPNALLFSPINLACPSDWFQGSSFAYNCLEWSSWRGIVSEAGKNLEGEVVDGKFPLLRYLGESDHSVVFLTERKMEARKVAIKLIPARVSDPEIQISSWEAAAKLSHPH